MNTVELTLDLSKHRRNYCLNRVVLRQGDKNGTTIVATITDNGEPFTQAGLTARFEMMLPDRQHYYRTDAAYAAGTVTVTIDETYAAAVPGQTNIAYIALLDGTTVIATTEPIDVNILRCATDGMEVAESYDSAIQAAIDAIPQDVADWLEDHPEATTTVQDESLKTIKLTEATAYALKSPGLMDGLLEVGSIDTSGVDASSTVRMRTRGCLSFDRDVTLWLKVADGYKFALVTYEADGTLIRDEYWYTSANHGEFGHVLLAGQRLRIVVSETTETTVTSENEDGLQTAVGIWEVPRDKLDCANGTWTYGAIRSTNGADITYSSYPNICRTGDYLPISSSTIRVTIDDGLQVRLHEYGADGTFVSRTDPMSAGVHTVAVDTTKLYRLTVAQTDTNPLSPAQANARVTVEDFNLPSQEWWDIPPYFESHIETAATKVRTNAQSVGRHGDTFVFISDTHWRNNKQHSPALIRYLLENTECRMVINGGDNLDGHLNPKSDAVIEIMDSVRAFLFPEYGIRALGVMGNHDENKNGNAGNTSEHLSYSEMYSVIYKFYDDGQLHFGRDGSLGNFYYWDNPSCKIRYIMLDWSGWASQPQGQQGWVLDTINAMPTGYFAVIVMHGIYQTDGETGNIVIERAWVTSALAEVKDRILFMIQGHTHQDAIMDAFGDGTVPIIITSCDTFSTDAGAVAGTISEQCFDVVTFDWSQGTLNCVRVGRGSDRTATIKTAS